MRTIFCFVFAFFSILASAQGDFELELVLTSRPPETRFYVSYYNGKATVLVQDSFVNNRMHIKAPFFAEYATFSISPYLKDESLTSGEFLIHRGSSIIQVDFVENAGKTGVKYQSEKAVLINDPASFKPYQKLMEIRREVAQPINELSEKHSYKMFQNDSLRKILGVHVKNLNEATLKYIQAQPIDYFSLWFFRTQVFELSMTVLDKDTSYLKHLKKTFTNTFPPKYRDSFEGQYILLTLEGAISPATTNSIAPGFSKKDIYGKSRTLSEFNSKYVLLDFWASWCPPCMAGMPHLKELKKKFGPELLTIVGISVDHNMQTLKKTVSNTGMDWIHFYDDDAVLSAMYAVKSYPTYILMDRNKHILFRGNSSEDTSKLADLLGKLTTLSK